MKNKLTLMVLLGVAGVVWDGLAQPGITQQPQYLTNCAGSTATLSVVATGAPPVLYQWRERLSGVFTPIPDATHDTLVVANVLATRVFDVVVTDAVGTNTSTQGRVYVNYPFGITRPPAGANLEAGGTFTCSVTVTSAVTPSLQWYFNGQPLPGQTGPALSLPNVQTTNAGDYWVRVANACAISDSTKARLNVTDASNAFIPTNVIPYEPNSCLSEAPTWVDYDNDGYQDLFVTYGSACPTANRLYRNKGDGSFVRLNAGLVGSLVTDVGQWAAGSWADADNDGWLDVFVSAYGSDCAFYRNNRMGGFEKVLNSGLPTIYNGGLAVWADYDNDGWVDAFATWGTGGGSCPRPALYHNDGYGYFAGVTTGPLSTCPAGSLEGVGWADYDNDGLVDLVAVFPPHNGGEGVLQYHNEGGGVFTRITNSALTQVTGAVAGPSWADYDNDGLLDVLITRFVSAGSSPLFHNDHNDHANQFSLAPGQPANGGGSSGTWADYDNDGDLDLLLATISPRPYRGRFYQNNGGQTFTELTNLAPVRTTNGFPAWGDYNNDGFMDLAVVPARSGTGEVILFRNNGNTNHWMMFKLEGTVANRAAIGAKVRVKATIFGKTYWQMRHILPNVRCNYELRPHFGLGDATNAEIVRIEWPSGQVTELRDVPAQQVLTIVEPNLKAVGRTPEGLRLDLTGRLGSRYDIHTSSHVDAPPEDWPLWQSLTCSSRVTTLTDTNVSGASRRFYMSTNVP